MPRPALLSMHGARSRRRSAMPTSAIAQATAAETSASHRLEELVLETAKLRESQEQADRWHTAQLVAAKDAEAARKSEAEAKRREAEAGETARALAHDVLLYHSAVQPLVGAGAREGLEGAQPDA